MKAKDLIKKLQTVDSETEIFIYERNNIANKYILLAEYSAIKSSMSDDDIQLDDIHSDFSFKIWILI